MQVKKGIFGHRRTRSQSEADYLCPLESAAPSMTSLSSTQTNGTPQWNHLSRSNTMDSRSGGSGGSRDQQQRSDTLDSRKNTYDRQVSECL